MRSDMIRKAVGSITEYDSRGISGDDRLLKAGNPGSQINMGNGAPAPWCKGGSFRNLCES